MKELDKLVAELQEIFQTAGKPFLLGITGAMAVGKTTFSHALAAALTVKLGRGKVSVISTDGFLFPNAHLERLGLLAQKGFPSSFDQIAFLDFLKALRLAQEREWDLPFYDQEIKDIHPSRRQKILQSDVYMLEGINLLFPFSEEGQAFDRLILLDKREEEIYQQFRTRFQRAFEISGRKAPYFASPHWQDDRLREQRLETIWREVHLPFYRQWVVPMRERSHWRFSPSFDPRLL